MSKSNSVRHHSAGTVHVAAKGRAHVAASHTTKTTATGRKTRGAAQRVSVTRVVTRGRGGRVVVRKVRYQERFYASSFTDMDGQTVGDVTAGEDPVVRAAAIQALGNMNGTAIAIDPATGRILAMVNQKLALSNGAEPCSTIKLTVALAALEEGIVRRDTPVNLGGRFHMTMTEALAHSNNLYFE